ERTPGRPRRGAGRVAGAQEPHRFHAERPRLGRREHHYRRGGGAPAAAEVEGREGPGHRGISPQKNRALMHILSLSTLVETRLLASRLLHDREAARRAARIVADVRRRGDRALFAWIKRLDGVMLTRRSLWVSQREIREAGRSVSPGFA